MEIFSLDFILVASAISPTDQDAAPKLGKQKCFRFEVQKAHHLR